MAAIFFNIHTGTNCYDIFTSFFIVSMVFEDWDAIYDGFRVI